VALNDCCAEKNYQAVPGYLRAAALRFCVFKDGLSVAAKEWAISADQNGLGRHELMAAKLGWPDQKSSKMCLDCSFFLARLASLAYEKRAIPGLRQSSWIKRAVEKDASRKSPEAGLSHFAWKSR